MNTLNVLLTDEQLEELAYRIALKLSGNISEQRHQIEPREAIREKASQRVIRELTHEPGKGDMPEWLRLPDAVKFSGLSKSYLYENFDYAGGKIKTRSLRQRNKIRGIRLVNVDSLRAFIESEGGAK